VDIPLSYSGPGADATIMEISPPGIALGPGGSQAFSATVLDGSGAPVSGVPLFWSVDVTSGISVSNDGVVDAQGEVKGRVTATSPTGLSASAWVYVVSGEIAFVRNGHLFRGPLSTQGGEDLTPNASAAGAPAWSPDGETLYFHENGKIYQVGLDGPLADGRNPSVHPDGTKLAVDHGGGIHFMNSDGTNPTEGPDGSYPQWTSDGESLFVSGGSLHRVRADGTDRRTLDHAEGIQFLYHGPSGDRLAYVRGGSVYSVSATGGGRVRLLPQAGQDGVTAEEYRPSMDQAGDWVLATGL
jgi:hypothetical protein